MATAGKSDQGTAPPAKDDPLVEISARLGAVEDAASAARGLAETARDQVAETDVRVAAHFRDVDARVTELAEHVTSADAIGSAGMRELVTSGFVDLLDAVQAGLTKVTVDAAVLHQPTNLADALGQVVAVRTMVQDMATTLGDVLTAMRTLGLALGRRAE